ncbi:SIR2 family protein [Clostridium perfringens]|uniref:SIR2 family protein n=1 Tax=Clostridium perfringens TaxID=1502 RepID=UPI00096A4702|nr:SIR2 family protein [Clostridium perfringens]
MENKSYLREMDDIVYAMKNAKENNIRINFLVGAGCSVTAGIPLAKDLIDEIAKKYPKEFDRVANKESYGECMTSITALERRNLIAKYVETSRINWANLMLAKLLKEGIIDCVLTTNFDNILMKASFIVGNFPAIYDLAASENFRSELVFKNSIIHLHGQHTGFLLCNSKKELDKQYKNIEKVFLELNKNSMWIVIGYSGESDPIVELFKANKNSDNRLFWIGYLDNDLPENLEELFNDKEKYCFLVKEYDADRFMMELSKELKYYPPKIIEKPFTYLNSLIDSINEFEEREFLINKNPIIETTKKIVDEAILNFEEDFEKKFRYYLHLNMFEEVENLEKSASNEEKAIIQKVKDEQLNIEDLFRNIEEIIHEFENKNMVEKEDVRIIISLLRFLDDDRTLIFLNRINKILEKEKDDYELIMCNILALDAVYIKLLSAEPIDEKAVIEKTNEVLQRLYYMNEQSIGNKSKVLERIILRLMIRSDLYKEILKKEEEAIESLDYALKIINSNKDVFRECDYYKIIIYIEKLTISQDENIDLLPEILSFMKFSLENFIAGDEDSKNINNLLTRLISYQFDLLEKQELNYMVSMISAFTIENKLIYENAKLLIILLGIFDDILSLKNIDRFEKQLKKILKNMKLYKCIKNEDEKSDLASLCNNIALNLNKMDRSILANEVIDQSIVYNKSYYNICTKGLISLYIEKDFEIFEASYKEAEKYTDKNNIKTAILQTKYKELALYKMKNDFNHEDIIETIETGLGLGVIENWKRIYDELQTMKEEIMNKKNAYDEVAAEIN